MASTDLDPRRLPRHGRGDLDLLARVVAHERWPAEWAPPHPRVLLEQPRLVQREEPGILWRCETGRWVPDPEDDATAGVLLGLLPNGGLWWSPAPGGAILTTCAALGFDDITVHVPSRGWAFVRVIAALWSIV